MSEYIPLEIQEEILKRLPLKPLLQFRTVSKSYKSLIDSTDFIVSCYVHHPQPDHFILRYTLSWSTGYPGQVRYITLVDNGDSFVQQEFIPPVPDLIKTLNSSFLFGSSHGLLCFSGYYYEYSGCHSNETKMVVLWNVSIRKYVGIRVPNMYEEPNGKFYDLRVDNEYGFGVCPVTFDPIVINITFIDYKRERNDIRRISLPWKVQGFTLSTGTWSNISKCLPCESIRLQKSQVVINRFIYWIAYHMYDPEDVRFQSRYMIMSFDLTAKEFKEIYLTGSLTNRLCGVRSIAKLRESLVLLEYHREFEQDEPVCCLWMMMEQGVSRSFTKIYTIELPDASIRRILGFRKTGELIIETSHKYQTTYVQIYEPNNEYFENLEIDGEDFLSFMCSYMETLYLLDKLDGYIYPIVGI